MPHHVTTRVHRLPDLPAMCFACAIRPKVAVIRFADGSAREEPTEIPDRHEGTRYDIARETPPGHLHPRVVDPCDCLATMARPFENNGYAASAPGWPEEHAGVIDARGGIKPLVGRSFGGLIAQELPAQPSSSRTPPQKTVPPGHSGPDCFKTIGVRNVYLRSCTRLVS